MIGEVVYRQQEKYFMRNFDGIQNHIETTQPSVVYKPKKRHRLRWFLFFLVLLVSVGFWFGSSLLSKANQIFTNKQNIFVRVGKLFVSDDKPLKGEVEGQVNILLLGMGGPGHEGPFLTDTMVVASINTKTFEVNMISIPRDFMVRLPNLGYNKINAVYAYAEKDDPGTGGTAAIKVAEDVTGLSIPYYASIDFKGFVKAVDHVDGLDILIDRTFTDSTYPNYNLGYLPPQTFTKGQENMNGERALIFARSRHGNNGEGSDFARSERQKKILVALKEDLMKLNITNVSALNSLLSDFTENFRTNLEPYELKRLIDMAGKYNGDNVFSLSLEPDAITICDSLVDLNTGRPAPPVAPTPDPTPTPTPTTTNPKSSTTTSPTNSTSTETGTESTAQSNIIRAYVVVPCYGKNTQDVHHYLTAAMSVANLTKESAKIEIMNSTGKPAASTKWKDLNNKGLNAKFITFSGKTPYDRTIVYDNTGKQKPKTLEYLKANYSFVVADVPYSQSTADFVVIIGNDYGN